MCGLVLGANARVYKRNFRKSTPGQVLRRAVRVPFSARDWLQALCCVCATASLKFDRAQFGNITFTFAVKAKKFFFPLRKTSTRTTATNELERLPRLTYSVRRRSLCFNFFNY